MRALLHSLASKGLRVTARPERLPAGAFSAAFLARTPPRWQATHRKPRMQPPGTPFRFALRRSAIRFARRCLPSASQRHAQFRLGRLPFCPKRKPRFLSFSYVPYTSAPKKFRHLGRTAMVIRRANRHAQLRASPLAAVLRAIRTWSGWHVFINARRIAHKMAFFPSVPRTVRRVLNG
jgi:hypothetical protein